nr:hypothetical protein [uncultured Oscillibacter sp.]
MAPRTLLIPSLLDDWFPLLRHAFASEAWEPVLLTGDDPHLAELGLRHFHNELCYPVFLVAGQVLSALGSGKYDVSRCGVLFGQAGDECRGSCGIRLMRGVLDRTGYADVALLSLNVRGIDRDTGLPITLPMVRRALAGAVWGDTLAILRDQTRPREAVPGAAEALWRQWMERLGEDLRRDRSLSRAAMLGRCREMAADFRALPTVERQAQKVAIVGEIYTKYCHLGNWDLQRYLAAEHCETGVGGVTWYALYYMDTHAMKGAAAQRKLYRLLERYAAGIQRDMLDILRRAGFETLPPFADLKRQAEGYAPLNVTVADGWLIAAEATAWAKLGYRKILCVQPFACLPGHIFGKGQYAALQRKLPGVRLVSVDYDASTGEGTVQSRVRMLLDERLEEAP